MSDSAPRSLQEILSDTVFLRPPADMRGVVVEAPLPCPCCGDLPEFVVGGVQCHRCGLFMGASGVESAVRAWNRRPASRVLIVWPNPPIPLKVLAFDYVLAVVSHVGGSKTKAAKALGIDRRTLYRILKRGSVESVSKEG